MEKKNKNPVKKDDSSTREKIKKIKCFYYKRQGHYIRDYAEKKKDEKERTTYIIMFSDNSSDDGYHNVDFLMASNNNIRGQWV